MSTHAIYPGTLDPLTLGHIDLIERALTIFTQLTVAIATSASKKPLFTLDERLQFAQQALQQYPQVTVSCFDGLMVDFAKQQQCHVILRGVRGTDDWEYEKQLAFMNKKIDGDIETLFILPRPELQHISSSLVKDVARHGGNTQDFVPSQVALALQAKLG